MFLVLLCGSYLIGENEWLSVLKAFIISSNQTIVDSTLEWATACTPIPYYKLYILHEYVTAHTMEAYGEVKTQLHVYLSPGTKGKKLTASRTGHITPRKKNP